MNFIYNCALVNNYIKEEKFLIILIYILLTKKKYLSVWVHIFLIPNFENWTIMKEKFPWVSLGFPFNGVDANYVVAVPFFSYYVVLIFDYFRSHQLNFCYCPHHSLFLCCLRSPVYVEQLTQSQLENNVERKYLVQLFKKK